MLTIEPTGAVLGATVRGVDLAQSIDARDMGRILLALGRHGVLRFPDQHLDLASPNAAGGLNGDAVQFAGRSSRRSAPWRTSGSRNPMAAHTTFC